MARCENCIHDKVCNEWAITSGIPFVNADTCEHYKPADVVPKKEIANVLRDLKIAVHNNTFHPNSMGISSYITIKTFDAVLQNFINKYDQKKGGGA